MPGEKQTDKNSSDSSAVLELVGLRELAEHRSEKYYEFSQKMLIAAKEAGKDVLREYDSETTVLRVRSALDVLFVHASEARILVHFCRSLRDGLLKRNGRLFLRGVLGKGDCFRSSSKIETEQGLEFTDLGISSDGVGLHGEMERLKGVGLSMRDDIRQEVSKAARSPNEDREDQLPPRSQVRLMENFFVAEIKPERLCLFIDLPLSREITQYYSYLDQAMEALRIARYSSRKIARFYVPFFYNWARNMDLTEKEDPDQLDKIFRSAAFSEMMREVPGLHLIALVLLNRCFGGEALDQERQERLRKFFLDPRRKWVQRLVRQDTTPNIPPNVLSPKSRLAFTEAKARGNP